jgi:gluconate 2-dehydrogenase gamma chain
MDRRDVVRLLAGMVAVPVLSRYSAEELFALGSRLNARARRVPAPGLFDPHQRATVAAIAERIIPETDTPGARVAGVHDFIELIVTEHYRDDERAQFIDGLTNVDERSQARFRRDFVESEPARQNEILAGLEDEAGPVPVLKRPEKKPIEPSQQPEDKPAEKPREARPESPTEKPAPFWHQIKFLTIYGYYTSKIGVTRELKSVMIPGRYDPCTATGIKAPRGS